MFIKKVVAEEPKLSIRGFKPFPRTIPWVTPIHH
jgi:hypothetical protein